MSDIILWFGEKILIPVLIFILVLLLIVVLPCSIYTSYKDSQSPTFELKKKDWDCTNVHKYTTTTFVLVGKIMVPQTTQHSDCIQWSHK